MHSKNLEFSYDKFPFDVWEKKRLRNPDYDPFDDKKNDDFYGEYADFLKEIYLADKDQPEIQGGKVKYKLSQKLLSALKCVVTVGGFGAGALYLGSGQKCADIEICGKWLADAFQSRDFAAGVLIASGGLDFSAGAAYMGAESIEKTIQYINKQSTLVAKIGKSSGIVLFALSQNIPLFFILLKTSTAVWQIPLTVGGALPGSIYGAIHLTEDELPYYFSQVRKSFQIAYHHISRVFSSPKADEELRWKQITRNRKNIAKILEQLDAKWQYVLENTDKTITTNSGNIIKLKDGTTINSAYISFLSEQHELQSSLLARITHGFGIGAGLGLAINFNAGPFLNTFNLLENYLVGLPNIASLSLRGLATAFFSASSLYGGTRITIRGTTAILDAMINILEGNSIRSLLYHLRPKTTALVTVASLASSALSYAVIAILYLNQFKPGVLDNQKNLFNTTNLHNETATPSMLIDAFYVGAVGGMDIYHFASLLHLYELFCKFFSKLTHNEKEQFLFAVENTIENLKHMPEDKWFELFKNHKDIFAGFDIDPNDSEEEENIVTVNQDTKLLPDDDLGELTEESKINEEILVEYSKITPVRNTSIKNSSWVDSWCNLFSCCHKGEDYYNNDDEKKNIFIEEEDEQSLLSNDDNKNKIF